MNSHFNQHIVFRINQDFNDRFNAWSKELGQSRSAIARYAIGQLLEYFEDQRFDIKDFSKSFCR